MMIRDSGLLFGPPCIGTSSVTVVGVAIWVTEMQTIENLIKKKNTKDRKSFFYIIFHLKDGL